VDERQHAKNLAQPQAGLTFIAAGAQAIPLPDASHDLAMMLKSLHHVPMDLLDQALGEAHRVLKPGGHLYVSEPVYDGPLNDIVKLFNDEGVVRAEAQAALDRALATGGWRQVADHRFDMPVRFDSFEQFETRMMRPTFADHGITDAKLAEVGAAYKAQADADGRVIGQRPMHVRLLQRT
jgi:ubiquinone/menaquinone biosynthesis C-methylase UbiE